MDNKKEIKKRVEFLLEGAFDKIKDKVDKAINSGAIDIHSWDGNIGGMILPKTIVIALMEDEANQYKCEGTSFEKKMKKDVNNLKLFL